jgi:hypothetical protein
MFGRVNRWRWNEIFHCFWHHCGLHFDWPSCYEIGRTCSIHGAQGDSRVWRASVDGYPVCE